MRALPQEVQSLFTRTGFANLEPLHSEQLPVDFAHAFIIFYDKNPDTVVGHNSSSHAPREACKKTGSGN